jgi:ribose 1,5-bisphosphate isomerase
MERVLEAAKRIRRMEVRGATNVALTAIKALVEQMGMSKARSREEALAEIEEARDILFGSRETEPFMRNALRYIEWRVREVKWETVEELNRLMEEVAEEFIESFWEARHRIVDVGSRRILPGTHILTHCHSSAVMGVLKAARGRGIEFEVICTETRPLYQGRITAKELSEAGVKVTLIIDSAVRTFLKEVDLVLVGADAITSEGNIINKIGTSLIALAAQEARVPFYVVTELLKFDPQTIHGDYEAIEERAASEIWSDAPRELAIRNPAFDVTRRDYIHGIICEEGVISPHSILEVVRRRYPWILESVGIPAL